MGYGESLRCARTGDGKMVGENLVWMWRRPTTRSAEREADIELLALHGVECSDLLLTSMASALCGRNDRTCMMSKCRCRLQATLFGVGFVNGGRDVNGCGQDSEVEGAMQAADCG